MSITSHYYIGDAYNGTLTPRIHQLTNPQNSDIFKIEKEESTHIFFNLIGPGEHGRARLGLFIIFLLAPRFLCIHNRKKT
ncbi:MAG: hypothetical protein LUE21_03945 [Oscillospiraceae bacterium]|nr:hypothetical protein [Oscillospiraceae bacterium]